jgi:hypothetical protein
MIQKNPRSCARSFEPQPVLGPSRQCCCYIPRFKIIKVQCLLQDKVF